MSFTPDEVFTPAQIAAIHESAERTAVAQGHPPKLEDPGTIARIGALVGTKPAGHRAVPTSA